jgi:hypothetical protein
LLALLQRNQDMTRRLRDMAAELASAKREYWSRWLEIAPVPAGQRCGTSLLPPDLTITKGSFMPSAVLHITGFERLASGGWLVTAQGWVEGAARKACERLQGIALSEMHNQGLRAPGEVRSCRIEGRTARLVARIGAEAEVAVAKIRHRVFPMIEITHDGAGEIFDVSLIDRPQDPDALQKRGKTVLAKLYRGEEQVVMKKAMKKAAKLSRETGQPFDVCLKALQSVRKAIVPALPASAQVALSDYDNALTNYQNALQRVDSDRMATKAALGRAQTQIGVELVKAAQARPVAHGDGGLVNFLRHGRP